MYKLGTVRLILSPESHASNEVNLGVRVCLTFHTKNGFYYIMIMRQITAVCSAFAMFFISGCSEKKQTEKPKISDSENDNHGHDHPHGGGHKHLGESSNIPHTPNHGIVTAFRSENKLKGVVEIKLHDDKGDLELWLTKDKAGTKPYDIPLNSTITVLFPNMEQGTVELKVRNQQRNEDENGKLNIRDQKTNYFIFPSSSGDDASFLVGEKFVTDVVVSFTIDGVTYTTDEFKLRPHTH